MDTIHLVLLVAATWRLSNLLANETGPFHLFEKLRRRVALIEARSRRKNGKIASLHLYEGVNCEYCNSIWFGALVGWPYALMNELPWLLALVFPLVLSTGSILLKTVINTLKSIDARFDQQNQEYLKQKEEQTKFGLSFPVENYSVRKERRV